MVPFPARNNQCSVSDTGVYNEILEVNYLEPKPENWLPQRLVLPNFVGGKRNTVKYKYVCKILSQFSETEYTLVGYKVTNKSKTAFKFVPSDTSTVSVADICAILPDSPDNEATVNKSVGLSLVIFFYMKCISV